MSMLDDHAAAAVALTSRLVESTAEPLSAREYWALAREVDPVTLLGTSARDVAGVDGERIAALLDRATGVAVALERLDHAGIWTVPAGDDRYPARLLDRLGDAAPVLLHGVGDPAMMGADGVGVVGARDAAAQAVEVARSIGEAAAGAGLPLVSGAAPGVDQNAMNGAFAAGGRVVGVLGDSLERAVEKPSMRRGVAAGRICLVTPYPPATGVAAGNPLERTRIVYALSRWTVVVSSERQTGETWAGASEALNAGYGRVASWTGAGCGTGNAELVALGAAELTDVAALPRLLDASASTDPTADFGHDTGSQLSLGFGP